VRRLWTGAADCASLPAATGARRPKHNVAVVVHGRTLFRCVAVASASAILPLTTDIHTPAVTALPLPVPPTSL
jgi:hypothetical protein